MKGPREDKGDGESICSRSTILNWTPVLLRVLMMEKGRECFPLVDRMNLPQMVFELPNCRIR